MDQSEVGSGYRQEVGRVEPNYAMDRLSAAFESSARRWELIVYPTLFAFIVLAAYGFYLVYSLARDVHYLAISVDANMTMLANNMQSVSDNMNNLSTNIHSMTEHMGDLSANVHTMTVQMESIKENVETLRPMLANINSMDRSMQHMTQSTGLMRSDMANMNRNISRPISFMNSFMPW